MFQNLAKLPKTKEQWWIEFRTYSKTILSTSSLAKEEDAYFIKGELKREFKTFGVECYKVKISAESPAPA